MKKLLFSSILLGLGTLSMIAQSGTKSPYSQYGLGILSDQSQGFNRGMSGLFQGIRNGNQVNMQNPASYSAVDSLSMIFDAAVSGQFTQFKEGNAKINAKTANFEYATALFRVLPKFGVSLGIVPYTNIGYDFTTVEKVVDSSLSALTDYEGSGGLHQVYIGLGFELFKGFSLGANMSYLWGGYERSVLAFSSEDDASSLYKGYNTDISSYKLDIGAQYRQRLSKYDVLTVGATFGLGHKLGDDAVMTIRNMNLSVGDTTKITNAFALPTSIGGGFTVNHKNSLTIGADYLLQRWSAVDHPMTNPKTGKYELMSGFYKDRHKVTVGADWIPDRMARGFFKRVHYKVGASYATPYYKINGQDGPKEITVSAGLGIPLVNAWNNRSTLNVSFQWVNQSAKNLITDNTFRVTIGLTFNERWFAKWKVE
jgi:hypothetical protein